ncbi:MAG: dihydrofolate reductase, partial [Patescibacteria group bacterium]
TRDPHSLDSLPYKPHAVVSSVEEGIEEAKKSPGSEEIFIFGGGQIFTEALEEHLVDRMYLTLVSGTYGADTFFPEYKDLGFHVVQEQKKDADGYRYTFLDLEK